MAGASAYACFVTLSKPLAVTGKVAVYTAIIRLFGIIRMEKELAVTGKVAIVFIKDFVTCLPFVIGLLDRPVLLVGTLAFLGQLVELPEVAELKKAKVDKKIKEMKLQPKFAVLEKAVISALK
jgi:hypothetical protein